MPARALEVVLLGHHSVAEPVTYGYGLARLHAQAVQRGAPARIEVVDRRADADEEEELALLAARRPDVIGVGAYLWSLPRVARLIDRARRELPAALIVLGGPSALAYPEVAPGLAPPHYRLVGEGEESFARLLAAHAAGELAAQAPSIDGLEPGDAPRARAPAVVARLDQLASPYLLDLVAPPGDTFYWETSRGCPHGCGFCLASTRPRGLRWFPIERLRQELAWARDRGLRVVDVCDTALNYRTDRLAALIEMVRQVDPDGRLGFTFALHADPLDERQIELLSRIRIHQVTLGLNSITPGTFAEVGRTLVPDRFAAAVDRLARLTRPVVSIILGLPGETVEGFARTLAFAAALPAEVEIFELKVIPETRFFDQAERLALTYDPAHEMTVTGSASFDRAQLAEMRRLAAEFQAGRGRWQPDHLLGPRAVTDGLVGRLREVLTAVGALDPAGAAARPWRPLAGWRLVDIDPKRSRRGVSLGFAHDASGERVTLVIGKREAGAPSFATTRHFDLSYPVAGGGPPSAAGVALLREACRRIADADR